MNKVHRIYVEKKPPVATSKAVYSRIRDYLNISSLTGLRILQRYDYEGIPEEIFEKARDTVFSEPPVDNVFTELDTKDSYFSIEYLPGQFDQRADSAMQALGLLGCPDCVIKCATTYVLEGPVSAKDKEKIIAFLLNPVDSRVAGEEIPKTLYEEYEMPDEVETVEGFKDMDEESLKALYDSLNLAMTYKDILHIQKYFKEDEDRDPTITEIRVFDTYWSDHCRHTTFQTKLEDITFEEGPYKASLEETFGSYMDSFKELYKDRDDKVVCLMDIALMAAKQLKKQGLLDDLEDSEEINACSIVIPVDVDGKEEKWLLNFKNETHNHPTEIEPFGGAATCLGGAIRDPLSGRTYCYQAMRVTGAADPTVPIEETIPGKLPQERIVTEAANGYSSYGNQIGLATGLVKEVYHPGFAAKRMEIGAVMAAAPVDAVVRGTPCPGDVIILLGGRTGRDGIGGATGSSKAHDKMSTEKCGAEVQKGNAPTERKLQRLFRRREASLLIKRCNDFGAGGVSVAIGELAPGLVIDLDKVPKKYAGLDGTELSISESQERMAVVVDPKDVDEFVRLSHEENLETAVVATVTEEKRLVINWQGKSIVNIKRSFLDTNGAMQVAKATVPSVSTIKYFDESPVKEVRDALKTGDMETAVKSVLSDLNVCSQKGLIERFDSSIGAGTVIYPFGGRSQMTPSQTMIAKIPVPMMDTSTASMMSYGYDPYLSAISPYHGAAYSVLSSVSKIVSNGGDYKKIRFTFQEYFERLRDDKKRWGLPLAALLGAYKMQMEFGLPAIGGKDSMSGSFEDLDVPPTLVSFAVDTVKIEDVITPDIKRAGSRLYLFRIPRDKYDMPDVKEAKKVFDKVLSLMKEGKVFSAYSVDSYGVFPAMYFMASGNGYGFTIDEGVDVKTLFNPEIGSLIIETKDSLEEGVFLGVTEADGEIYIGEESLHVSDLIKVWEKPLNKVFPIKSGDNEREYPTRLYEGIKVYSHEKFASPRVFIPVFPGTNCEYDLSNRFVKAGAKVDINVLRNNSDLDIKESIESFKKSINEAQIIMFPGGFSAGDEPEGSAKFFSATFRNEMLKDAVFEFLNKRDGLILGICNGFQALVKLGLLPYGEICTQAEDSPTLTYNSIGRHIARICYTKVCSNDSPWLSHVSPGEIYSIPISHGEGRFFASDQWIKKLYDTGRVATRYVDFDGSDTLGPDSNPNGSFGAIEGILSPDGRIFGKMGHIERIGEGVGLNVYGPQDMRVFESGVEYFK